MLVPKRTGIGLCASLRATRCLSTTAVRPWATPTSRPPAADTRSGNPVDDIDLVFDYPTEGQSSHQKQRLEASGLDLHSALPHHPKPGMQGQNIPGAKMGKEMGYSDNSAMYRYVGLGALGLGGLYMMMRRQSSGPTPKPASIAEPGDLVGHKSADKNMERMLGRGR